MPSFQSGALNDEAPELPPFYSPPPKATPQTVDHEIPSAFCLNSRSLHHHEDALPDLVSPGFTPPSTPGAGIPITQRKARSVAVDSTQANGGCGSKQPKLLETLPEVTCIVRARIPTTINGAEIFLHSYRNNVDRKEHLAIVFGDSIRSQSLDRVWPEETEHDRLVRGAYTGRLFPGRKTSQMPGSSSSPPLEQPGPSEEEEPTSVRIHSECYTGETVWSARCDCGEQLDEAARLMSLPGSKGGVIIYLKQEGRGIGLSEKLKAYNLQDLGNDTVQANLLLRHPADARSYGLATAMLLDLGQKNIRLFTNNPDKVRAVEGPNREIVVKERVAMIPLAWQGGGGIRSKEVEQYMKTKVEKMSHMLDKYGGV